jgi:hypothetical protein
MTQRSRCGRHAIPGQNIDCCAEHRSVGALRLGVSKDDENVYGDAPGEVDFAGGYWTRA